MGEERANCQFNSENDSFHSQSCCDTHFYQFEINDDFERALKNKLELNVQSTFIDFYDHLSYPLFYSTSKEYSLDNSPKLTKDILVNHQVFLI